MTAKKTTRRKRAPKSSIPTQTNRNAAEMLGAFLQRNKIILTCQPTWVQSRDTGIFGVGVQLSADFAPDAQEP